MKKLGIIGYPLKHSFSQKYFTKKFEGEGITNYCYKQYEIDSIEKITDILADKDVVGLNVTIPYKELVMPYLTEIDATAAEIKAVNCIKREGDKLIGYNTDIIGFEESLLQLIGDNRPEALVFGTGGASKAICYVLKKLGVNFNLVSRRKGENTLSYDEVTKDLLKTRKLLINTTPLGTFPNMDNAIDIPYDAIDGDSFVYDLVYNPSDTKFIRSARYKGAKVMSGYKMLISQAEAGWKIYGE
ncbi:MAG: shikimate dehydrogenase [Rikenellaceae bacterium]